MKLSFSNIGWEMKADTIVYEMMKHNGFQGLEIAPTRIFPNNPYDKLNEAKIWKEKLRRDYDFEIPSMQSIWYGRQERIYGSVEERKILTEYTKKAIDFASAINCKNLVFGCPRNRNVPDDYNHEILIRFFKEIGDYAASKGTVIGMEANPTIYNTNYINDTYSAVELINQVNSDGFKLNLDIGTVIQNKEDIYKLVGWVNIINHVHISEPELKPIKQRQLHIELRDILNNEDYQGYVSVEIGKVDDIILLEKTMGYVKGLFDA